MTPGERPLPEGTDSIIDSDGFDMADRDEAPMGVAEVGDVSELDEAPVEAVAAGRTNLGDEGASTGSAAAEGGAALFGRFDDLRGQATDRAFAFAQAGKDRATGAIDDVVRMVEDAAGEIDAKVGPQYGDYARRAAETLGGFSDAFKAKEVDDLFADARELVQKSPGVAIGAAAAIGFVLARLVKAGVPEIKPAAKPEA